MCVCACVCVCLVSRRAELQYRQFSTVERAHQTSALLSLRADNMGPSYLLGASEPPLLPLNELQRGESDWQEHREGCPVWLAVLSRWTQGALSGPAPLSTRLPLLSWLALNGTVMSKTTHTHKHMHANTHTQPSYCLRQGRVISKEFF